MLKFFRNRRYPNRNVRFSDRKLVQNSIRTARISMDNFLLSPQPTKGLISDEWDVPALIDDEENALAPLVVDRKRDIVSVVLDLEDRPFTIADYKLFVTADFYHRWSLMNEKDSLLSITTLEHGSKHITSFDPDDFEDIPDYLDQKLESIIEDITQLSVPIENSLKRGRMNVVKIQEFTEEYGIQEQKSTKVKTEQGYYQSSRYEYQRPTIDVYKDTLSKLWSRLKESGNLETKTVKKWFSEVRMEIVPHRFQENNDGRTVDIRDGKELVEHEFEAFVLNVKDHLDQIENQIGHFPEFDYYRSSSDESQAEILLTREYSNWGLVFKSDSSSETMMASDILEAAVGLLSLHEKHWPPAYHVVDSHDFHSFLETATILTAAGFRLPNKIITATSPKLTDDDEKSLYFEKLLQAVNGQGEGLRWYMLSQNSALNSGTDLIRIKTDVLFGMKLKFIYDKSTSPKLNPEQTYPLFYSDIMPIMPDGSFYFVDNIRKLPILFETHVNNGDIDKALQLLATTIDDLEVFLQQFNPPELPDSFEDRIYIETVLHAVYESLRVVAILMQPAAPSIAYKILNRLGIPLESRYLDDAKDSFSGLDEIEFERSGRRLGPNQGLIFQTNSVMVAKEREQSRLIAAQEKREHKRLHGQVTKNVVGEGYGPGKGKSKTAMRKKKSAIWKKERDQKKLKARMERLESQKMDSLEDFPDMDDYKYSKEYHDEVNEQIYRNSNIPFNDYDEDSKDFLRETQGYNLPPKPQNVTEKKAKTKGRGGKKK